MAPDRAGAMGNDMAIKLGKSMAQKDRTGKNFHFITVKFSPDMGHGMTGDGKVQTVW